mgnify:CR=1 FL=1
MLSETYKLPHTLVPNPPSATAKLRTLLLCRNWSSSRYIPRVVAVLNKVMAAFNKAIEKHIQRQKLTSLTTEQLRDIGITHSQAIEEAGKPFWR